MGIIDQKHRMHSDHDEMEDRSTEKNFISDTTLSLDQRPFLQEADTPVRTARVTSFEIDSDADDVDLFSILRRVLMVRHSITS